MKTNKTIWIVGGSSGIGLELVKLCLNDNFNVIASSRNAQTSEALLSLQNENKNLKLINCDASKNENIASSVKEAWECFDGIDIWFYNAGAYEVMSLETWNLEKFEQMNNVNYLGVVRIMTEILPYFQEQKSGHWVWNSSLSSYFGLAQAGGYSAPKAALINLAESIQAELELNNINLQIINHGFVKTRLTAKNTFEMPQLMQPKYTAENILKGIKNPNCFEIRFPFFLSFFLRIMKFLPYKLSLAINKKLLP